MIDVVVPVYRDVDGTRRCLERVLATHEGLLDRLIVVNDRGPEPRMLPMLRALRSAHAAVRLLDNERNLGFVGSANRGLLLHRGDVVILNSDTYPAEGWLRELAAVLAADSRIAAASPLSNNGTLCSVPRFCEPTPAEDIDPARLDLSELPPFTEMPTAVGFCMLMRGAVVDELGGFDPAYGRGYNEENDWCQRARARGYIVGRANRAYVAHLGQVSFGAERAELDVLNARRLSRRFPAYLDENRRFAASREARLAAEHVASRLACEGQVAHRGHLV